MKLNPTAFQNLAVPTNFSVDNFIDTIRLEKGDLSVIHPESFVEDVHSFFRIQRVNIEQICKIYQDYSTVNPLDNYDRIEETVHTATSSGINSETAVDTTEFKDTAKTRADGQNKTTSRIRGNIGVTTASDMATKHTQFFETHNMYREVANLFVTTLCICTRAIILEGVNVW